MFLRKVAPEKPSIARPTFCFRNGEGLGPKVSLFLRERATDEPANFNLEGRGRQFRGKIIANTAPLIELRASDVFESLPKDTGQSQSNESGLSLGRASRHERIPASNLNREKCFN